MITEFTKIRNELLKSFIIENNTLSIRSITKLFIEKNPDMYKDFEEARTAVRFLMGSKGAGSRKKNNEDKNLMRENSMKKAIEELSIPESDYVDPIPFIFPITSGKGIIAADFHLPYHDKIAVEASVQHWLKYSPDFIFLNGDVMDIHELSYFMVDPKKKEIGAEIELTNQFLKYLRGKFKKSEIFYKFANHEERFERFSMQKAPELYKAGLITNLRDALDLKSMGIAYIPSDKITYMNKLNVLHGHEYKTPMNNPVSPARGIMLKARDNCIVAHFHQPTTQSSVSIRDKNNTCWSIGCMCGLHPEYRPKNDWAHGYAEVELTKDDFCVSNKKIMNCKIYNA